jgi:phasin family protein
LTETDPKTSLFRPLKYKVVASHHNRPLITEEPSMFSNSQQAATKILSFFQSQTEAFQTLASTAVEGVERAVRLNLTTAKSSIEESVSIARQLSAAKNSSEIFSLLAAQAQPTLEKATSYSRALVDIASGVRDEFAKLVQAEVSKVQSNVTAVASDIIKTAPAESQNAVTVPKLTASPVTEKLAKASRQTAEAVDAEADKATEQLTS